MRLSNRPSFMPKRSFSTHPLLGSHPIFTAKMYCRMGMVMSTGSDLNNRKKPMVNGSCQVP